MNFLRKASSLSPMNLHQLPRTKSLERFKKLVLDLTASKIISNEDGDKGITEFRDLMSQLCIMSKLKSYTTCQRLDTFFFTTLEIGKYSSFSLIVQSVLVLHNGQAEVERGFSVSKEIMEDNMSELTLVSRRLVKDYLRAESIECDQVVITKEMVRSVQSSRFKYDLYLKEKQQRERTEAQLKEQEIVRNQLKLYRSEKESKQKLFEVLKKEANDVFMKASQEENMTKVKVLLVKGKGLNEEAEKVQEDISVIKKKIEDYKNSL